MRIRLALTRWHGETVAYGRNVAVRIALDKSYRAGLKALTRNDPFTKSKPCWQESEHERLFHRFMQLAIAGGR